MNPTLPQIAFWLYAAIGLAVALYLWLSSVAKHRIKTVWLVGSWLVLSEFIFFISLLLWPLWLGVLWLGIRNERRSQLFSSPSSRAAKT